ncbi:MAG: hypothetical protein QOF43_1224 [Gaiellaceae bacterium]|jgi:hypothetical protein|nr:hypothetical protein [Gaiellaceae bacterium]
MTAASGRIASTEPSGLALRTAKHFAHKVPVTEAAGVHRIETRFGSVELEPREHELLVRLDGDDLEQLRSVAVSHLERFSRDESFAVSWD